jgi:hypothetical protein
MLRGGETGTEFAIGAGSAVATIGITVVSEATCWGSNGLGTAPLSGSTIITDLTLTRRLSDADADVSAAKALLVALQSLLQGIEAVELDVTETLGLIVEVLHDADAGNLRLAEEALDVGIGGIERDVAEMNSVWGTGRELNGSAGRVARLSLLESTTAREATTSAIIAKSTGAEVVALVDSSRGRRQIVHLISPGTRGGIRQEVA